MTESVFGRTAGMRRIAVCLAVACAGLGPGAARGGTLWTLDGKTYEGDVRLLATGQALISAKTGPLARVDLSNVLYATVSAPPAVAPGAPLQVGMLFVKTIGKIAPPELLYARGLYSVRGGDAGAGVGGAGDGCAFLCKGFYGNGECAVRILDARAGARVGVMFREDAQPDARQVSLLAGAKGDLKLCFHAEPGKGTTEVDAGTVNFPVYLRLVRSDRQFIGYKSSDGRAWDRVAQVYDENRTAKAPPPPPRGGAADAKPPGVDMMPNAYAGVAFMGAGDAEQPASALFDQPLVREQFYALQGGDSKAETARGAPQFISAAGETLRKGLLLRTGTFLAGATLVAVDPAKITVHYRQGERTFGLAEVARLQQQEIPAAVVARVPERVSGVVLATGDFMEGEIARLDRQQIEISNVTLGLANYRLNGDVQAILWREADANPAGFRVRLTDGSLLVARSVRPDEQGGLAVDEYALGAMKATAKEIVSVQGAAERTVSLLSQRSARVEGPGDGTIDGINCFMAESPLWLTVGGAGGAASGAEVCEQGIVSPAGTAVSFRMPAGTTMFAARLAVPGCLPEKATVRFIVLADGKELYRSAERSSRDAPLSVSLALAQVKLLTLRVEAPRESDLPTYGLWGNPLVVR